MFGTSAASVQRRRRHRAVPAPRRAAREQGLPLAAGVLPAVAGKASTGRRVGHPAGRGPATWPRSPRRVRGYHADDSASRPPRRGGCSSSTAVGAELVRRARTREAAARLARRCCQAADDSRGARSRAGPPWSSPTPATSRSCGSADRELRTRLTREYAVGEHASRGWRCRGTPTHGELLRFLRAENLPGYFPFTAGVFPFKRDGEDPARMFAGEGDAVPHQPPVPPAVRRAAGDPAVDRVRLGHPVRPRPGRAPRHLRQGRHLRGVDRHARRHEGALRRVRPVRPDDVGVDDDQRPGPDDPGVLPEHRHRPAARRVPRREGRDPRGGGRGSGRGCCAPSAAPCRPTSSRRTRARTPASSPPSSRCG